MNNFELIKKHLQEGKSLLNYPEAMNNRELTIIAIEKNVENYKHCNFNNDKIIALKVASIKHSYLYYMSEELKNNKEFAHFLFSKTKNTFLFYFFNDEVKFSQDIIKEITSKRGASPKYLLELKKRNPDIYYKYYEKFPMEYKNINSIERFDLKLIKIILNNPTFYYLIDYKLNMLDMFDRYNFLVDKEIMLLLLNRKEKSEDFLWKKEAELFKENYENIDYFRKNYKFNITPSIMKLLLKNKEFKEKYYEMYKNNPQKKDYRSLLREVDLFLKIDVTEKEEIKKIKAKI
jgi:hypothetical protein